MRWFAGCAGGERKVCSAANVFSFQHPENATPASDVSAAYKWSADLEMWHADGATAGATTVNFSKSPNTPVSGITTVTATITGAVPEGLFVAVEVNRATP